MLFGICSSRLGTNAISEPSEASSREAPSPAPQEQRRLRNESQYRGTAPGYPTYPESILRSLCFVVTYDDIGMSYQKTGHPHPKSSCKWAPVPSRRLKYIYYTVWRLAAFVVGIKLLPACSPFLLAILGMYALGRTSAAKVWNDICNSCIYSIWYVEGTRSGYICRSTMFWLTPEQHNWTKNPSRCLTSYRISWYLRYSGLGQTSGSVCKISLQLNCRVSLSVLGIQYLNAKADSPLESPHNTATAENVICEHAL